MSKETSEWRDARAPIMQAIIAYRSLVLCREDNIKKASLLSFWQEHLARFLRFIKQLRSGKLRSDNNRGWRVYA